MEVQAKAKNPNTIGKLLTNNFVEWILFCFIVDPLYDSYVGLSLSEAEEQLVQCWVCPKLKHLIVVEVEVSLDWCLVVRIQKCQVSDVQYSNNVILITPLIDWNSTETWLINLLDSFEVQHSVTAQTVHIVNLCHDIFGNLLLESKGTGNNVYLIFLQIVMFLCDVKEL